jgi:hypothetical protein
MDFIIKPSPDGASGCLTSTKFPQKKIIHPFLGKKIKVCEVTVFDLIMIDLKLSKASNLLNPIDGKPHEPKGIPHASLKSQEVWGNRRNLQLAFIKNRIFGHLQTKSRKIWKTPCISICIKRSCRSN